MSVTTTLTDEEIAAWVRLTTLPGLGPTRQQALLAEFGLPQHLAELPARALAPVIGDQLARQFVSHQPAEQIARTTAWLREPGHHLLTLADPRYPPRLLEIADPPTVLYVNGDPAWLQRPCLAIVGSRHATPVGEDTAQAFARHLSEAGLTIVSGLAQGIDAAAHAGGLAGTGRSVAVVGTGADRIYPARNASLAHRLAAEGAVVAEFPLGTGVRADHFPRRNRLIAGLSLGVLVVEAALQSGSLITARLASECGREVLAIPGSIHSPLARGCHQLIRQGAELVESAQDVLEELRLPVDAVRPETTPAATDGDDRLSAEARQLLASMGHDPISADRLVDASGLTITTVCAMLTELELAGLVCSVPGGCFQRRH